MMHAVLRLFVCGGAVLAALVLEPPRLGAQRGVPPTPAPRDPRGQAPAAAAVPAGTAVVSGSVLVAGTGLPARRARVTLSATENGVTRTATTDEQGQFTIAQLLAGRYSLNATKPGHINVSYGQTRPGRPGTPIQLADGQRFTVRLQMFRGGVITGTVLDENAEAIPGTQVRVLRYVLQSGQRSLQSAGSGTTDDRGIYRIYGLQPGDYLVAATPRNTGNVTEFERMRSELESVQQQLSRQAEETVLRDLETRAAMLRSQMPPPSEQTQTGYSPIYYPGTTSAGEAGTVTLAAGEEKPGVDFQLQRVPIAVVDGTVINSTGHPLQNMQVMLISRSGVPDVESSSAPANAEGRFRLPNVAPGQYTLHVRASVTAAAAAEAAARGGAPAAPSVPSPAGRGAAPVRPEPIRYWASADIVVDGRDVSNVILALQPGLNLSGRVLFDGASPPADLTRVRLTLDPIVTPGLREPAQSVAARVDASGRFTMTGIVPGRYSVGGSGGRGWSIASAVIDTQDALDFPLEIKPNQAIAGAVVTFSDRQAEIAGVLTDDRGQPASNFTIVLYPADQRYWVPRARRIRTTRPATDGRYTFANVPAGDYRLAAVFDVEPGAWFDPAFLQQLDTVGVRVVVNDGEKKAQNLQIR